MKIGGVDPKTLPPLDVLVLPRGDSQIVFKARGIQDYAEFNKLCPDPTPPGMMTKDGWMLNYEDKNYRSILIEWNSRRLSYMMIKSLEPSDIEWETVNLDNPGSWKDWETELSNAGLIPSEINRVIALVFQVNSLDESKIKRARELFLRGPQTDSGMSTSPITEPANTPSGEPAVE